MATKTAKTDKIRAGSFVPRYQGATGPGLATLAMAQAAIRRYKRTGQWLPRTRKQESAQ